MKTKKCLFKRSKRNCIIFCVCAFVFALSLIGIFFSAENSKREKALFDEIRGLLEKASAKEKFEKEERSELTEEKGQAERKILDKYKSLFEMNEDMAGWIKIENTNIDYPVMVTPNAPDYYLYRAFDKTSSQSGTPFIGDGVSIESESVIIHGHNMKDGSMFADLEKYEKEDFWRENPTFTFDTIYEERTFEVVSVIRTRVLYTHEEGFRYYRYSGDLEPKEKMKLFEEFKKLELYDTGAEVKNEDKLVMLSTCGYHEENGRIVLLGRLISE